MSRSSVLIAAVAGATLTSVVINVQPAQAAYRRIPPSNYCTCDALDGCVNGFVGVAQNNPFYCQVYDDDAFEHYNATHINLDFYFTATNQEALATACSSSYDGSAVSCNADSVVGNGTTTGYLSVDLCAQGGCSSWHSSGGNYGWIRVARAAGQGYDSPWLDGIYSSY